MRLNAAVNVFCLTICSALLLATSLVANRKAEARKMTCDERIDKLETDLRLRGGELAVARDQLAKARKKLKKCGIDTNDDAE